MAVREARAEAGMSWIVTHMKWIMVVAGALTCTMFYTAIAPEAALRSTFGETLDGPLAEIIVRNWGALIAIVGAMLIYGAFDKPSRPPILIIAALGKLVFVVLVVSQGGRYLSQQAGVAVVVDSLMVLIFAGYLLAVRGRP
jgi:hypothetical protein